MYGHEIEPAAYLDRNLAGRSQLDRILLGRYNHRALGSRIQRLSHAGQISDAIRMMVAENNGIHDIVPVFQPVHESGRIAYGGHGYDLGASRDRRRCIGREYRLRGSAHHPREEQALVGIKAQLLARDTLLQGIHRRRTLGHADEMRTVQLRGQIAQTSPRQHVVLMQGPRIVYKHDIHLGFDPAMLEPVVHNYEIHLRMIAADSIDALRTTFAHRHDSIRKFELYLLRFVARAGTGRGCLHFEIALGPAAVAARKQRHVIVFAEMPNQHLGERGLAGAAHGDVPYTYYGNIEPAAFQQAGIEQLMPNDDNRTVNPRKRNEQKIPHHEQLSILFKDTQKNRIIKLSAVEKRHVIEHKASELR